MLRAISTVAAMIGQSRPENFTLMAAPHAKPISATFQTFSAAVADVKAMISSSISTAIATSFFTIAACASNVGSNARSRHAHTAAAGPASR